MSSRWPDSTLPHGAPPSTVDAAHRELHQAAHARLRVVACGGDHACKRTLLDRLLHERVHTIEERQDAADPDARRCFTWRGRTYTLLEVPAHAASTRELLNVASTADAAILLVDAREGVTAQTRIHTCLLSLLGMRHVVLAVNKMDLVAWDRGAFEAIASAYAPFARQSGLCDVTCVPIAALSGDNVAQPSAHMPWYTGASILASLDALQVAASDATRAFRMPVQRVTEEGDLRGCSGIVSTGRVRPGERVVLQPSGTVTTIARVVRAGCDAATAAPGEAVTLTFADPVDARRGDVVAAADAPLEVADQFQAYVVWMDDAPLLRGRSYRMRIGSRTVSATVAPVKYRINLESLEHVAADRLEQNEIGVCDLELDGDVPFTTYADSRDLGGFDLIDPFTERTVAAGMLRFALRRARNVTWQSFDIDKATRATAKLQKPCVVWFTGLSGAGKSTIANLLERRLHALGLHTYVLDGDNVRKGLNKDLGFTDADRVENIRRVAEVAALMVDAGLVVITAFISPFRSERAMARSRVGPDEFVEVFVDTPLEVAEQRDPKGLYRKARAGTLLNFTGIDSPYEPPVRPDIVVDGSTASPQLAAERIVAELRRRGTFVAGA